MMNFKAYLVILIHRRRACWYAERTGLVFSFPSRQRFLLGGPEIRLMQPTFEVLWIATLIAQILLWAAMEELGLYGIDRHCSQCSDAMQRKRGHYGVARRKCTARQGLFPMLNVPCAVHCLGTGSCRGDTLGDWPQSSDSAYSWHHAPAGPHFAAAAALRQFLSCAQAARYGRVLPRHDGGPFYRPA